MKVHRQFRFTALSETIITKKLMISSPIMMYYLTKVKKEFYEKAKHERMF